MCWIGVGCSGAKQQQGNFSWGRCWPEAFALSFSFPLPLRPSVSLTHFWPFPTFHFPSHLTCFVCSSLLSLSLSSLCLRFVLTKTGVWNTPYKEREIMQTKWCEKESETAMSIYIPLIQLVNVSVGEALQCTNCVTEKALIGRACEFASRV